MITLDQIPSKGSGVEVVKMNQTLYMGTLVHIRTTGDPPVLTSIGLQDITGAMYWIGPEEIDYIRPHRQGRLND